MAAPASTNLYWRFGVFEVDTNRGELRRAGIPLKLRHQSFQILLALLERPGKIVTREELRRRLWPSDTFVDFDHSLNTAMMKLRDALGDSTDAPIYIETVPKRGYRFIAPVLSETEARNQLTSDENEISTVPASKSSQSAAAFARPARLLRSAKARWSIGLAALGLLAVSILLLPRSISTRDTSKEQREFAIVPVTSAAGMAQDPALSPDGKAIAYVMETPDTRRPELYVILIGGEQPLRLTYSDRGVIGHPTWSPNGRDIAFTRCQGSEGGIYVIPALGGAERKMTAIACHYDASNAAVWLSGGTKLVFTDLCKPGNDFGLVSFSLETGERQCLTKIGQPGYRNRYRFSLSTDGTTIAFLPSPTANTCEIHTISASGGSPHLIFREDRTCFGLMWDFDGKSIVFASERTTLPSLWRIPAGGGPIQRDTKYPALGSISSDGKRFVFFEQTSNEPCTIWRAELAHSAGPVISNRRFISTQYCDLDAQPSPDGSRIVFVSSRTGFYELWTSDAEGRRQFQITHLSGYAGTPRWSADGESVVFDRHLDEGAHIFTIDREGRNLQQITASGTPNVVPSWSRDGRAIYFTSRRTGTWEVWKRSLDDGTETKLSLHGGFDPVESFDGKTVYFSNDEKPGIWKMPSTGGPESQVLSDKPLASYWGHWAVTKSGLYVLNVDAEPRPSIEFYDFKTGKTASVLRFEMHPAVGQASLSATADGKTIYYTQWDRQSVIKMMDFR